jgi:hypothetical protein
MNLSSLVHAGRHQAEQQQQQQFRTYSTRPQQIMSSSMIGNPYNTQPMSQNSAYAYVAVPQPPPSPPVDETSKCSLPSISSLLGLADGSSPQEQAQQGKPRSLLLIDIVNILKQHNPSRARVDQAQNISNMGLRQP